MVGDRNNARQQLKRLLQTLENAKLEGKPAQRERLMVRFSRLEHAAMQLETPETFGSASGLELKRLFNEIRGRLGESVPDPIPLEPGPPPKWAKE